MSISKDNAVLHYKAFRTSLLAKNGVEPKDFGTDKRTCYELVTQAHHLETKHEATLQSACQVIDGLVAALNSG